MFVCLICYYYNNNLNLFEKEFNDEFNNIINNNNIYMNINFNTFISNYYRKLKCI